VAAVSASSNGAGTSYYGQPILKQPVWTPEIPAYFFTGGLAGASAGLAYLSGEGPLARRAWATSLAAAGVSAPLLIADLGVPSRFLNMLRMLKVTSPMSVGTWILSGFGAATTGAAAHALTGRIPRIAAVCRPAAALLGLPLSTYTGALVAQTSVPVWHEARRHLPVVFAAGAAVSAGAAATALTPPDHAAPARRLTVTGAVAELGSVLLMEHRLGKLGEPYSTGQAGTFKRLANGLVTAGALTVAGWGHRSRPAAVAGAGAVLIGAACERFSIFRAGFQSAADPKYVVGPQRARVANGERRGASRRASRAAAPNPAG
jgi:formate-dependent nitrite reductase membrane component NrfD